MTSVPSIDEYAALEKRVTELEELIKTSHINLAAIVQAGLAELTRKYDQLTRLQAAMNQDIEEIKSGNDNRPVKYEG